MLPIELVKIFLSESERVATYRNAIDQLRSIGFENLIRRVAEPTAPVSSTSPVFTQATVAEFSKAMGWLEAIDAIFNFPEVVGTGRSEQLPEPDFGADDFLTKRYNNKQ